MIQKEKAIAINIPVVLNQNEEFKVVFETFSKKQKSQELYTSVKTALLLNKLPKEVITIKLLNKGNGITYKSNLETIKSIYEKRYNVLNSYIEEKQLLIQTKK